MRLFTVFIRMAQAFLFYPLMVGVFLWLYIKDAHWIFGLAVIAAILIIDPILRIFAANMLKSMGKFLRDSMRKSGHK